DRSGERLVRQVHLALQEEAVEVEETARCVAPAELDQRGGLVGERLAVDRRQREVALACGGRAGWVAGAQERDAKVVERGQVRRIAAQRLAERGGRGQLVAEALQRDAAAVRGARRIERGEAAQRLGEAVLQEADISHAVERLGVAGPQRERVLE